MSRELVLYLSMLCFGMWCAHKASLAALSLIGI